VLRFSAAMRTLGDAIAAMPAESRPHTHTLVIKYPFKYFSSTHTADRPWSHMLWMCTQVRADRFVAPVLFLLLSYCGCVILTCLVLVCVLSSLLNAGLQPCPRCAAASDR